MDYRGFTKRTESNRFFVRAFVCLQHTFQNLSILVSKHSLRSRDRLNSLLACSRAKNKDLKTKIAVLVCTHYLKKPLHLKKEKEENYFLSRNQVHHFEGDFHVKFDHVVVPGNRFKKILTFLIEPT